jgi:hypothetical protein
MCIPCHRISKTINVVYARFLSSTGDWCCSGPAAAIKIHVLRRPDVSVDSVIVS